MVIRPAPSPHISTDHVMNTFRSTSTTSLVNSWSLTLTTKHRCITVELGPAAIWEHVCATWIW